MRLAALLLAPMALLAQGPQKAPSACENTPAYTPCEIAFELSRADAAAHPVPYNTVDVRVELRSPRHRTYALSGYWDGGNRMAIRVTPTEAGKWDYRITSNVAAWNGQEGSFIAASSGSPGFIRPVLVHHWAYTEPNLGHLWMGASEPGFASMDDAAFNAMADARAGAKFNHIRGQVLAAGAYSAAGTPNAAYFQRLDRRVLYLNRKGIIADLVLAERPSAITSLFKDREQLRRFVRYVAARYAAMNVTWHAVAEFESDRDGRGLLRDIGTLLKDADPYAHPRTSGARVTSAPLLDDGWMDFCTYGAGADDSVGSVEHQLYATPFVNMAVSREAAGGTDGDAGFRSRLWNAAMNGQYVSYAGSNSSGEAARDIQAMTVWFDILSGARHWELEPYFDVDGGRAVALEDAQYIIYVEKPGRVEAIVEKRTYEVRWIDPANGQMVKSRFKGDRFSGEPPDRSHDWVLHLIREGRLENLARSYKFESRSGGEESRAQPIGLQEVETVPDKTPFEIEAPSGDVPASGVVSYSAKIKRQTRATSSMRWLWTGQVTSEGQGRRVLATGQQGEFRVPAGMAFEIPATMLLRVYGMNANGKVYELTRPLQLVK